jgi:hypothetical protein
MKGVSLGYMIHYLNSLGISSVVLMGRVDLVRQNENNYIIVNTRLAQLFTIPGFAEMQAAIRHKFVDIEESNSVKIKTIQ